MGILRILQPSPLLIQVIGHLLPTLNLTFLTVNTLDSKVLLVLI